MHAPLAPEKRLLLRAADLLRERGWTQNTLRDGRGRMCAIGALQHAATEDYVFRPYISDAVRHLDAVLPTTTGSIVGWNNAPERTVDEVIEAMERAALS